MAASGFFGLELAELSRLHCGGISIYTTRCEVLILQYGKCGPVTAYIHNVNGRLHFQIRILRAYNSDIHGAYSFMVICKGR